MFWNNMIIFIVLIIFCNYSLFLIITLIIISVDNFIHIFSHDLSCDKICHSVMHAFFLFLSASYLFYNEKENSKPTEVTTIGDRIINHFRWFKKGFAYSEYVKNETATKNLIFLQFSNWWYRKISPKQVKWSQNGPLELSFFELRKSFKLQRTFYVHTLKLLFTLSSVMGNLSELNW